MFDVTAGPAHNVNVEGIKFVTHFYTCDGL